MEVPLWITLMLWASRLVLILLVGLSIWSVATMIQCYRLLRSASGGEKGPEIFNHIRETVNAGRASEVVREPEASLYHAVVRESASVGSHDPQQIDRSVKSLLALQRTQLEGNLTVLATLGSNAPFIGLFGTVLGIVQAFGALGNQAGNSASVMTGISEALVATAVGLFVAIPAVMAFNYFSRKLRVLVVNCEALRDLYVARLKRA